MIRDVLFSKRTTWEYEKEYRFIFNENFGQITSHTDYQTRKTQISVQHQTDKLFTDISIDKKHIKSIIFGIRTNEGEIQVVKEILSENNYNCNLFNIKMVDGKMKKLPLK